MSAGVVLENLALRQQLATLSYRSRRPHLVTVARLFWVALRPTWADWAAALAIVKPATVVAWHRRAYRADWRRISGKPGRPRTDTQLRDLIGRMVPKNHWGARRIHGELLKLGCRVSERTVSRYMRAGRPRPLPGTSWKTFLNDHREALGAMDAFTVRTLTFRLLCVLVVIEHARRAVPHVDVTVHLTAAWVSQQLREAFPFGVAPRFLKIDRDSIFSAQVCRVLRHMDVRPARTSCQSPWQNGVAERRVGTCRREWLAHVLVLGEEPLRRLLHEFLDYSHSDRTHLSLGKDPPLTRALCPAPSPLAKVTALPRIGGIHHRYKWREAA